MNQLIVHTGVYTQHDRLEVIGSVIMTPAEMSNLGRSLRPNDDIHIGDTMRQVFTNSDHVLNGIRLSIKYGSLLPDEVLIMYTAPGSMKVKIITIDKDGMLSDNPEGFFTQIENDLLQLF